MTPAHAPAEAPARTLAAPTGAEYARGLRDGRRIYIDGGRIDDPAEHPATRRSVRSIAMLYDALRDPEHAGALVCPTDPRVEPRGLTHAAFRLASTHDDLARSRRAMARWAELTFGWMGRSPDYKAALTNAFGAASGWFGPFAENARRWHALAQRRVPFLSHAIVDPPIDRHLSADQAGGVRVRAMSESSAGLRVSGAKVVATAAAISDFVFIGQTPASAGECEDAALMFIVPVNAPGVRLICRRSYEAAASSPFDAPLASRFDENDAIVVLDDVLVPWENVLVHRDLARCRDFFHATGFMNGFLFHGCVRFGVKLGFIAGLLARALRCTGGDAHKGNRALLGEVIAWRHTFLALADAMTLNPDPFAPGVVVPGRTAAVASSVLAPECWARVREIVERCAGSALIYLPSCVEDLRNPEIAEDLARYVRGSHGIDAEQRIKTMKLLWDAAGSEFAGRHSLYERCYAGNWDGVRLQAAADAEREGRLDAMIALSERCMAQYDASGFTADAWRDPVAPEAA